MAEKEYIERGAAKEPFSAGTILSRSIRQILDEVPAADVVEVVRCKNCKFWSAMDNGFSFHNRGRADGECEMLLERHYSERHLTGGEHFCSYGERKENNR